MADHVGKEAMRGLILSGGRGTRLRPLTHTSAKQLLPIGNRPILFYAIETLAAAGITDIGIVVGDRSSEIRSTVGDGERFGVSITYIEQDAPRGLAHAVQVSRAYLAGDDFLVYLGDNLIREGIGPVVAEFNAQRPDALIVLARVDEPQEFGIAEFEDGRLVRLVEKPVTPTSDLAVVGVYLFRATVFDAIARIEYSARGELEITDAIQRMIDTGLRVSAHVMPDASPGSATTWKDTGSLDAVLEANRLVLDELRPRVDAETNGSVRLEGNVVIERGAVLQDCVVRGPAIIGADTVVESACVGPYTSISAGCVVRGAEVENSILLQGSVLENAGRINASLIGRHCSVRGTSAGHRTHKLLLGDHAQVELS